MVVERVKDSFVACLLLSSVAFAVTEPVTTVDGLRHQHEQKEMKQYQETRTLISDNGLIDTIWNPLCYLDYLQKRFPRSAACCFNYQLSAAIECFINPNGSGCQAAQGANLCEQEFWCALYPESYC